MLLLSLASQGEPPLADVHVHFKWNQAEVTTKEQAVAILRANDIAFAVVIGLPAGSALDLKALAPKLIVPIWSPYQIPADWSTWAFDKDVLARARAALAGGRYFGIGELRLIGGFAPDWRTPVISGLMELAAEYGVPVLLHTEIYFHRKWLQQLSPSISEKLRITNARDLSTKPGSVSESTPSDAGSGERGRVQGQSPDLSFNTQDRLNRSVCRRLC